MNDRLKLAIALSLAVTFSLAACQKTEQEENTRVATAEAIAEAEQAAPVVLSSGIDTGGFDTSVRPQDDLFNYVNGKWIAETELPADQSSWGTFYALHEQSQEDIRILIEEVSAAENVEPGSATQKIRDYYNSYMDTGKATELGVEAIRTELNEIASIESYDDLFRAFSTLAVYGVTTPISSYIDSDLTDPDINVVFLAESGPHAS